MTRVKDILAEEDLMWGELCLTKAWLYIDSEEERQSLFECIQTIRKLRESR